MHSKCSLPSMADNNSTYFTWFFRVDGDLNIKVADFGLARDVYVTDYYRHKSDEKLPVKWMAPEALNDRINNEKTDVVRVFVLKHDACTNICESVCGQAVHKG